MVEARGRPSHDATLRARAREDARVFRTLLVHAVGYGAEIEEWQDFVRLLRKQGNKYAWRRLMARRTSAFAVTLRAVERVLGDCYAGRFRALTGLAWDVVGYDDDGEPQVVVRVRSERPKTLDDLRVPVTVEILHAMVDPAVLAQALISPRRARPGEGVQQEPVGPGMTVREGPLAPSAAAGPTR